MFILDFAGHLPNTLNMLKIFWAFCFPVSQSGPTLCDPMGCSTSDVPVLHHLPELVQTHVHWVSDTIQSSHSLSSPFSSYLQSFPASGSFPISGSFSVTGFKYKEKIHKCSKSSTTAHQMHICFAHLGSGHNKIPQMGDLSTRHLFLTVLEAGSPRSACQPGWVLVRVIFLIFRWLPS